MGVNSRLGLEDTLPFGKFKGQKVEDVYKVNASYLMWLRDEKADPKPNPDTGEKQAPNRQFFDDEVLALLNKTIEASPTTYLKHKAWPDVGAQQEPDDTPFAPTPKPDELYQAWGAF